MRNAIEQMLVDFINAVELSGDLLVEAMSHVAVFVEWAAPLFLVVFIFGLYACLVWF